MTGKSLKEKRTVSSVLLVLACSCQAQDGTQKMSPSCQSKRCPAMIEWPWPLATL